MKIIENHKTVMVCHDFSELEIAARQLLSSYPDDRVFAFYGEMGAGKTSFIKKICEKLHSIDVVTSPTFSIVNVYETENVGDIYHFDFYRMKKAEEIYDIGYEDYLFSGNYCFMEWPEKVENLLPRSVVRVYIEVNENNQARNIRF
jgi:tRNA threonylcarbamoyladenosine biosynthesis protein TsaE